MKPGLHVPALKSTPDSRVHARLEQARDVLDHQSAALDGVRHRLDAGFSRAIDLLLETRGHVIVSGMGKSGQIGKKIASTFASTGTPSFFMHAGEAFHGDLGMIRRGDVVILISYSGSTDEVVRLVPSLREAGVSIIAMVGNTQSPLASCADAVLDVSVDREVCPNNLAPTTSALATLAVGDALAVALMRERDFRPDDFAKFHPGGTLGKRLLSRVRDVMHTVPLPVVSPDCSVGESLLVVTGGRLGLAIIMSGERLLGIVTDGDLRRAMQRHPDLLSMPIGEIMTTSPVTISEDARLTEAHQLMRRRKITALVVVDNVGKVSGILELFDE